VAARSKRSSLEDVRFYEDSFVKSYVIRNRIDYASRRPECVVSQVNRRPEVVDAC